MVIFLVLAFFTALIGNKKIFGIGTIRAGLKGQIKLFRVRVKCLIHFLSKFFVVVVKACHQ